MFAQFPAPRVPLDICKDTVTELLMMTRFAAEELIIMPESIRGNNFTEKGTIIQFHKTTSPITARHRYP